MMKWASCALILLAASHVAAQAPDTVFLPGGGRLRGTVEVYEPGRRVVVLLPDGTRRRLARGEFERVVFGDAPESGAAPSDEAPDSAPPVIAPPVIAPPVVAPPVQSAPPVVAPPAETGPVVAPPAETAPIEPTSPQATPLIIEVPPPEGTPVVPPAAPASPTPEMQTLEATDAPTAMPARAFGDQRTGELPWPEDEPSRIAHPRGFFHVGAQVLGIARISRQITYGVEVAPYLDLRLALPLHLRAALVLVGLADQGTEQEFSGGYDGRSTRITGHGIFELAGRVLLGILASDGFVIRIGGQIGLEVISHVESTAVFGDGVLELAIRVLESRLELLLSITGGARATPELYVASRAAGGVRDYGGSSINLGIGLGLGYVFY